MAVFTVTASDQAAPPRLAHTGVQVVRTHLGGSQLPASFSASDIILIAKIPNQAWIVDFYMSGIVPSDATVFKVGVTKDAAAAADEDALSAALTLSATAALKRADAATLPVKISLSDGAVPQYAWVYATRSSGTATITCSIQFVVTYAGPGAI